MDFPVSIFHYSFLALLVSVRWKRLPMIVLRIENHPFQGYFILILTPFHNKIRGFKAWKVPPVCRKPTLFTVKQVDSRNWLHCFAKHRNQSMKWLKEYIEAMWCFISNINIVTPCRGINCFHDIIGSLNVHVDCYTLIR